MGTFTPAQWLAGAERVLGFRLGDRPFITAAGTGWLRVYSPAGKLIAEDEVRGAAQVLTRLPDTDSTTATFAVGRGISREDMSAPMSATIYRFDGRALASQTVALPATTRTQVVAIAQPTAGGPLWLTAFESKYQALLLLAEPGPDGAFTVTRKDSVRVPLGMAVGDPDGDGESDVFIARPYGDGKDEPGDVFRWRAEGQREVLPTTRGARAVAVVGESVLVADGWHKDYGRRANALITRIVPGGADGAWRATRLVHVAGRHGYDRIHVGYIDGDDAIDLVASGNGPAVLVSGLAPVIGQVPTLGDVEAYDVAIAALAKGSEKTRRMDVIIAGPNPGIWRLDD